MVGTLPRERVEAEPTEVTTKSHFDDISEALKRGFLSSLISTKKLLQKRRSIPLESHEVGSLEKVITVEEHNSLITVPLSNVPSSHIPTEALPLSDSNKEIERYLEQIMMGMMVEKPVVQISLDAEGVGKPLELEHDGIIEVEAATVKGVLVPTVS